MVCAINQQESAMGIQALPLEREIPHTATKTQCSQKIIILLKKKTHTCNELHIGKQNDFNYFRCLIKSNGGQKLLIQRFYCAERKELSN